MFWVNEQPSWLFLADRSIYTDQLSSSGWPCHPIQHFEAWGCCRQAPTHRQCAAGCIMYGEVGAVRGADLFWVHTVSCVWVSCLTPSSPMDLQCSTCSKCFLSRTELRLHEAFKHRGEKLFVCEECGHRASSRNGLQMHIKAKHRYDVTSSLLSVTTELLFSPCSCGVGAGESPAGCGVAERCLLPSNFLGGDVLQFLTSAGCWC